MYIGRYEELEKHWRGLGMELGMELPDLGWSKKASKRDHYSLYYDDKTLAIVNKRFERDARALHYHFEKIKPYTADIKRNIILDKTDVIDDNVNGPSLMKDKGRYILYFANHRGEFIRKAMGRTMDSIKFVGSALDLKDTPCKTHIASPDAYSDLMYFHGDTDEGQFTFEAKLLEDDGNGPNYHVVDRRPFAHFYFKRCGDYAIAKKGNECGILYELVDGEWKEKFELIDKMRHACLRIDDNIMSVFYTQAEDPVEHIRVMVINMDNWEVVNDYSLLTPYHEWEGAFIEKRPSKFGAVWDRVNQVRDPHVFQDSDGSIYMLYSYAGESGIAYTKLTKNI